MDADGLLSDHHNHQGETLQDTTLKNTAEEEYIAGGGHRHRGQACRRDRVRRRRIANERTDRGAQKGQRTAAAHVGRRQRGMDMAVQQKTLEDLAC